MAGESPEKLSLPALQSKTKRNPEGYISELQLLYNQFYSAIDLYKQQAALNFSSVSGIGSDRTISKDLGDRALFLAHVTPLYPKRLVQFPRQLADFFRSSSRAMPSGPPSPCCKSSDSSDESESRNFSSCHEIRNLELLA